MVHKDLWGYPSVEDRVLQAAVKQKLEPIFEEKFLDCSYGFRPNRSAHMALEKIRKDLLDGYVYVIDADLQSYFDTIPHEKLMEKVGEEISDGSVLNLIELFLKSGVMDNGSFYLNDRGSPQGGVCSPLLSNIYLHAFDAIMVERGHRITRFADDFVICCRSAKGAERVMKTMKDVLEKELGLTVHPTKTKVVDNRKESFVFLGHSFKRGFYMTPSDKAMGKFKERVREITRRNQTVNVEVLIKKELNPYLRGWGNYFGHGHVKTSFKVMDGWIRRRLRMVQMRSWRNVNPLHRKLRKKGWENDRLYGIRMTAWRNSACQMVHSALDNKYFEDIGLCSLLSIYNEHHPQEG
jgi:group II intron reverse transcriptase/maturase